MSCMSCTSLLGRLPADAVLGAASAPMQAVLCMLAFFTIFWWHGVPLSVVYNHGTQYWMNPESGNDLSFSCW